MLYNTSLSLSYLQYFVPLTSPHYITPHPVTTTCLVFYQFCILIFCDPQKGEEKLLTYARKYHTPALLHSLVQLLFLLVVV